MPKVTPKKQKTKPSSMARSTITCRLEKLPIEVLLSIISYLPGECVLALGLTNHDLHFSCITSLERHAKLSARYSKILINCNHAPEDTETFTSHFRSPITILHHIQCDPAIAYHIREVHFMNSDLDGEVDEDIQNELKNCDLHAFLAQCPWFDEDDRDMWQQEIKEGNHGTALVLLLTFLPNLRRLFLAGLLHTYSYWMDLLVRGIVRHELKNKTKVAMKENLTSAATMPRPGDSAGPLRKISSVHVEHLEETGGESLHSLLPLTMLPSMTHLNCIMVNGFDIFQTPVRTGIDKARLTCAVRHINFTGSAISPANLARFIAPMSMLESLDYEHTGPPVGGPPNITMQMYKAAFDNVAREWLAATGFTAEIKGDDRLELRRLSSPKSS